MAICDREVDYANRFQEYLSRKSSLSFQIQVFSTPEQLIVYSGKNPIEILILGENVYSEQMKGVKTNHMVLLAESEYLEMEDMFIIQKYQSTEKIIREIMYYYGKLNSNGKRRKQRNKEVTLIGIYTPIGRCLQTSFSLLLGQLLSKKRKVLYLNFEAFSGFGKFMKRDYQSDLIDVMYLMNQMEENFHSKLYQMIEHINGLDYIPPAFSFMDLSSVQGEKWIQFISGICEEGDYDYIILDLSDNMQGLLSILQKCSIVFTLTKDDGISMAKIDQYRSPLSQEHHTFQYQT